MSPVCGLKGVLGENIPEESEDCGEGQVALGRGLSVNLHQEGGSDSNIWLLPEPYLTADRKSNTLLSYIPSRWADNARETHNTEISPLRSPRVQQKFKINPLFSVFAWPLKFYMWCCQSFLCSASDQNVIAFSPLGSVSRVDPAARSTPCSWLIMEMSNQRYQWSTYPMEMRNKTTSSPGFWAVHAQSHWKEGCSEKLKWTLSCQYKRSISLGTTSPGVIKCQSLNSHS